MKKEVELQKIRHSLCHLMTMALLEIYPQTKLGVGPVIENGFYQDYDLPESISPEILPKLEKRIKHLIKQNIEFKSHNVDFAEARKMYKKDPYKTELINELEQAGEKNVSFYKSGNFENLCLGPHVASTKEINPEGFKLMSIAGAYWKGDEKNKMLTRIYGVAFETKEELAEYLEKQKQAELRDHRKLGKELDLFVFSDLVGKGLPMFSEKGATIRRIMEKFAIDEEIKRGYHHVHTPPLAKVDLYKKSGHYPYYKDSMYPIMKVDDEELILRPMTCPHHFMYYKSKPHSYKELPYRIAEIAQQFRYEKSGELSGLNRVRMFCLADAHIICQKDKAKEEIKNVIELIEYVNKVFGLEKGKDYRYRLSLGNRRDTKKYFKDDKAWDFAEGVLRSVLKEAKAPFYEARDEAAFYGPKIDVQMDRVSGQEETAFTVQYDFVMPDRFDLVYIDENGKEAQPVVIHRSSIGAIERVMAFLIEKYAGNFPLWLAPVQVAVLPVSEKHTQAAQKFVAELKVNNIRVEIDANDETVGKKIRTAKGQKIPYVLVFGDKETQGAKLAINERGNDKVVEMTKKKFLAQLASEVKDKTIK